MSTWSERRKERQRPARPWVGWGLLAAFASVGCLFAAPARAQQTIFNVPSADVLGAGKVYLEGDDLWRPGRPEGTCFTLRGVVGLGEHAEGGVNVGGLVAEGRSVPTAMLALKWQELHSGQWAVTTGVHGLFSLRGHADGSPSAHAYAHAAWTPVGGTRVTAGVWYATSGFAAAGATKGVLAGIEQHVTPDLVLQTDWFSGRNGIGYLTPGLALTVGKWVIYGGYSLKNGASHENAALIELGWYL